MAAVDTRYVDGVQFPDGAVGALLASGDEVDISQLIQVEALMSAVVGDVKYGEVEAGDAAHVHLVGGKSSACADGVGSRALDVLELNIPGISLFVADYVEDKGHGVVDTLDTVVGARMVGSGGNLTDTEVIAVGEGSFGANLEAVFAK